MKVHECNEAPVKASPRELSWDEITQAEGVYKAAAVSYLGYFVVLIYEGVSYILYYNEGALEPASSFWSTADLKYVRVENAQVCFEIKED